MWEEREAGIYTRRCVFFGQTANLEGYLDEGARDEACKNYAAQGAVQESFEVALPWC